MKKFTNLLLLFIMGIFALVPFLEVSAKEPANIYIFHGETCQFCQAAIAYFDSLKEEYGYMFNLVKYEVWNSEENSNLMQSAMSVMGDKTEYVPYIIIGEKTFVGYSSESDDEIVSEIKKLYDSEDRYDVMDHLDAVTSSSSTTIYITLGIIVIGLVCVLGFSKAKAN